MNRRVLLPSTAFVMLRSCAAMAALALAACSETTAPPEPQIASPSPQYAARGTVTGSYQFEGITTYVRQARGATVLIGMTDVGDGPRLVYIQRRLPKEGVTFLTYVVDGKMVTAKRLPDGTFTYSNKRHDVLVGGMCGDRWADAAKSAGKVVEQDCGGGAGAGDIVIMAECVPTPDYDCGGGGDGAPCCQYEKDRYDDAMSNYLWGLGEQALACMPIQGLVAATCTFWTAKTLWNIRQMVVASKAYNTCKEAALATRRCTSIAVVPWDKKEVPA